jgi:hypothetical protein
VDDAGNWSGTSNILRWDWVVDTAPPAAPGGVTAARESGYAHVRWSANSEPDLAGYSVWRATSAGGPYTALTGSLITSTDYIDSSIPAGSGQLWYQVSASDETGNESARSAAATVSFAASVSAWTLEPVYPNPSGASSPVTIPVVVPSSGAGSGRIEVTDDAGRRVRTLPLSGYAPGRQLVMWDGLNDSGRLVAPGVYRTWIIAGDTRTSVRLVRVP